MDRYRQTGRDRDDEIERDGDTQSTPLYDWDRGGQGSHAYGGYGEAGFGPRGDRYGGDRFAGRERTERSHYSARHPRDFASDDRHRDYRSRSHDDYRHASRDEDLADSVSGVKHVQNNLRVDSSSFAPQGS